MKFLSFALIRLNQPLLQSRTRQRPQARKVQQLHKACAFGLPFDQHVFSQQHVMPGRAAPVTGTQVIDAVAPGQRSAQFRCTLG
jgi:hypothetical protein